MLTVKNNQVTIQTDGTLFSEKLLAASEHFDSFMFLRGEGLLKHGNPVALVAAGVESELRHTGRNYFDSLETYRRSVGQNIFGFLGYDLKNELEKLSSDNPDITESPAAYFFEPAYLFDVSRNSVTVSGNRTLAELSSEFERIYSLKNDTPAALHSPPEFRCRYSKEAYYEAISEIKKHLQRGDIYELNFCIEFYAESFKEAPAALFSRLYDFSPMPFSLYFKMGDHHLLCASPERFLKKEGKHIISQPMKGTVKRGNNELEDAALKLQLENDQKERSENIMIVDLVRNDLSKVAAPGTVRVDELCSVYQFPNVFQMISTVSAEVRNEFNPTQIIAAAFPMGSMTGAPKIRAMQLIDTFEHSRRGVFSGAAGYLTPNGDFDFNVIIRSFVYNAASGYLSYQAGSAITIASEAEKEYNECMLKAASVFKMADSAIRV